MDTHEMLNSLEKARDSINSNKSFIPFNNETLDTFQYSFYDEKGRIYRNEEFKNHISFLNINYKTISEFIEKFDFESVVNETVNNIESLISSSIYIEPYALKKNLIEICDLIIIKLNEFGFNIEELNSNKIQYFKLIESCSHYKALLKAFKDIVGKIEQYAFNLRDSNYGSPLNQIISFINDNYKDAISLSDVADNFHINKSYLCQLFKKKTGQSFNEYLTIHLTPYTLGIQYIIITMVIKVLPEVILYTAFFTYIPSLKPP